MRFVIQEAISQYVSGALLAMTAWAWAYLRRARRDLDIAHEKIRAIEKFLREKGIL